jgi:hypothetical protein
MQKVFYLNPSNYKNFISLQSLLNDGYKVISTTAIGKVNSIIIYILEKPEPIFILSTPCPERLKK